MIRYACCAGADASGRLDEGAASPSSPSAARLDLGLRLDSRGSSLTGKGRTKGPKSPTPAMAALPALIPFVPSILKQDLARAQPTLPSLISAFRKQPLADVNMAAAVQAMVRRPLVSSLFHTATI